MKIANTRLKKRFIIVISSIIITVIVFFILVSPIAKYLVEKYDEEYTGRQIKMDWVYVNPFTGYVYFSNLKIYEHRSLPTGHAGDSIFISLDGLSANFAILKLFSKTIEVTDITLVKPWVEIVQKNHKFNFDDLVTKFSSSDTSSTTKDPIKFYFLNIKIIEGHFYYIDQVLPINFSIKDVNIESNEGWYWNKDFISAKFSFLSELGSGGMKGNYSMNLSSLDYKIDIIVNNFDLKVIAQYLKGFTNYGTFRANLNANLKTKGCYRNAENINIKGLLEITDFHLGKNQTEDYLSFKKLAFKVIDVNPGKRRYFIDTVSLYKPYFKYEQYDYLDNLERMFGKKGSNILVSKANPERFNLILTIADYIKVLAGNFLRSDYNINKMAIYKGVIKFNDYSLNEKFSIEANPLNVIADSINKKGKWAKLFLKSGIQPYGDISVTLGINPKDSGDFDIQYNLQRLPVSVFNPYLISYTSFPLDRGTIDCNGTWNVRNGIIKSNNHLLIIDPRVGSRLRNNYPKWIPIRLVMFFIRERSNVIDYEIPITGNLKNPKFHLRDVIFDMLKNIFVKPPTTLYRMRVKNKENEIEKSLTLKWEMRQSALFSNQEKFVKKMVDFLVDNPDAAIVVYPMQYAEKEKEYIGFFEAKKKYFLFSNHKKSQFFTEEDSLFVDEMSVKDSSFISFLNKQVHDPLLFTIQDKCNSLLGSAFIKGRFNQLNKDRKIAFMSYFKKKTVGNRVKIHIGENNIPYNGFSFFKIVYKGEFPESLIKAYRKMIKLNNSAPRKRFLKERNKIKRVLQKRKQL